jgi:hypothetical protein
VLHARLRLVVHHPVDEAELGLEGWSLDQTRRNLCQAMIYPHSRDEKCMTGMEAIDIYGGNVTKR